MIHSTQMQKLNTACKVVIVSCLFLYFSCIDDDVTKWDREATEIGLNRYEGGIQQPNPYTTLNMKMALDTIKAKVSRGEYKLHQDQFFKTNSSILDQFNVSTTYNYIKFTPQSEDEIALIKQDSTLHVVDYPLDYEFDDSFYDDRPELPEGEFPEYFVAVPVGKSLPNVAYEALGDLYIPEEDDFFNLPEDKPITEKTIINNEEDLLHHLLFEAYSLVGKEDELLQDNGELTKPNTNQKLWIFGRKWYPSGTITLWDDIAGSSSGGQYCYYTVVDIDYSGCTDDDGSFLDCPEYVYGTVCVDLPDTQGSFIPLAGAQVLIRQFFTIRQGITGTNGNFSTGSVRGKARYVLQWERYEYSIRRGLIFQAETRGPKVKNQPWDKNLQGGRDQYHATIHTAAHNYYYGNRFGTKIPPQNSNGPQMKIAAQQINNQSSHIPYLSDVSQNLYPRIQIKEWGAPSDQLYGTVSHELAHAAHRNLDFNTYSNVVWDGYTNVCLTPPLGNCSSPMGPLANNNRRLMETWATTIEVLFTRDRYINQLGMANYVFRLNNLQEQRIAEQPHYTSIGIDMLEGNYGLPVFNQGFGNNIRPEDRVNNYTINQLEDALIDASSWWEW